MTNHQKRLSAPTSWPVGRKTETFTVKADAGPHGEDGVPLLILLRDVLGYVDSRKEARYALDQNNVLVNGAAVSDATRPIGMFDILAFDEREEFYRVFPDEGGRLALTPIDADAAGSKLGKIIEKRTISGSDVQLTTHDGATLLVDPGTEYTPGDSLVLDNEDGSVVVHFPYEAGALVTAVDGQHAGEIGTVDSIDVTPGSGSNTVTVETEDGTFETVEEYVVVIDENFTAEEGGPGEDHADEVEPAEGEAAAESDDEAQRDDEVESADVDQRDDEGDADDADEDGVESDDVDQRDDEGDADDADEDGVESDDVDQSDDEGEPEGADEGETGSADEGGSEDDGKTDAADEAGGPVDAAADAEDGGDDQ